MSRQRSMPPQHLVLHVTPQSVTTVQDGIRSLRSQHSARDEMRPRSCQASASVAVNMGGGATDKAAADAVSLNAREYKDSVPLTRTGSGSDRSVEKHAGQPSPLIASRATTYAYTVEPYESAEAVKVSILSPETRRRRGGAALRTTISPAAGGTGLERTR
ncbi:hypothetical protein EON66_01590 [archaeon]|nr:MAG: hypothetical protein EON66_01590 [archaeon]